MTPAELHRALGRGKTPFRPFVLQLSDGRLIICDSTELWAIAPDGRLLFLIDKDNQFTILAAEQIVAIGFLDSS